MAIKYLSSIDLGGLELLGHRPQHLTTSQINAITGGALYTGRIVYDSSVNTVKFYDGNSWLDVSGDIKSVTAGNGLTGTATSGDVTLHVGAGTGISVAADSVALSHLGIENLGDPAADRILYWNDTLGSTKWLTADTASGFVIFSDTLSLSAIPNSSLANSSVTVTAGAGLTGGGAVALGAATTLNIGAGDGISVAADSIAVDATVVRTTGAQTIAGVKTFSDNVILSGNLTVNGTTTTVNSNTVNIGDNIIVLNSDEVGAPTQNGGIEIERGTSDNVLLIWDEATDRWTFTNDGTTYYNVPVPADYAHPTQTAISRDGGGISFLADITVNTLGHVTAVTLDTIQDSSTSVKGVVELATNGETVTGTSTTLATTPAGVAAAISSAADSAGFAQNVGDSINSAIAVVHNLGTQDVIVQVFDRNTFETVYVDTVRTSATTVTLTFAVVPAVDAYRVVISKVV